MLRSIDDAREIIAATLNARRAIVLGGGVLGLEAASGLARRDLAVTVVHPSPALMERQLDEAASRVVESTLRRTGVDQRVGVGAQEIVVEEGRLRRVHLTNGEVLAADLLVLSTGTVPNTQLAEAAGIDVDRGILVDADLTTSDPHVHAIGDCAQPPGGATGLVAQGWEQARRLADLLTGRDPETVTTGVGDVVKPKTHGVDIVTMGVCGSGRVDDPGLRVVQLSDRRRGSCRHRPDHHLHPPHAPAGRPGAPAAAGGRACRHDDATGLPFAHPGPGNDLPLQRRDEGGHPRRVRLRRNDAGAGGREHAGDDRLRRLHRRRVRDPRLARRRRRPLTARDHAW